MKYLRAIGIFFGGFFVQWIWSVYFSTGPFSPQVLLILTMAISFQTGPIIGQCYGFAWGLLLDAMGVHAFGANALTLTLVGYFVGMLRRQIDVAGFASQVMLAALLTPVYFLFLGFVGLVFGHQFLWIGWNGFLIDPLYNCLVAIAAFSLVRRFANF